MLSELEIYKDDVFRLYECNGTIYLRTIDRERYLGSADIIPVRELSDEMKVKRHLCGALYRVMTIKPYDPETDSDAEIVGEPCSKQEAVDRLWSIRYNIEG